MRAVLLIEAGSSEKVEAFALERGSGLLAGSEGRI